MIANDLKALRLELGISQAQFAKNLHIGKTRYGMLERGEVKIKRLARLAIEQCAQRMRENKPDVAINQDSKAFKIYLRDTRLKLNVSQIIFAHYLGIRLGTFFALEKGNVEIKPFTLLAIERAVQLIKADLDQWQLTRGDRSKGPQSWTGRITIQDWKRANKLKPSILSSYPP